MSRVKALAVLLASLALVLAAPASALLSDLAPSSVTDKVPVSSDDGQSEEVASGEDVAPDEIEDRLPNAPDDAAPPPVAIAEVSLLDAEGHEAHPYLCPAAKKGPGGSHGCPADRAHDVDVRSDRFTVRVTLINVQDQPTPRTVRVLLFEDGRQVAQKAVVMNVEKDTHVTHRYEAVCECYRPSGVDAEVRQAWIVDLVLAPGAVGHDYKVVAVSGADADPIDRPASTDDTGTFTAHPAETSTAGETAFGSAGTAVSGSWLAFVAASATALGAVVWAVKRRS